MQKRHTNRERYFEEQAQTTRNYYIPYIKGYFTASGVFIFLILKNILEICQTKYWK